MPSDKLRHRTTGKAATVEDEDETDSLSGVILDEQGRSSSDEGEEQEDLIKDLKEESKKAGNLVQWLLVALTGMAMVGAYLFPSPHFSLPPFVSFLLTVRPLLPGHTTPNSLKTPFPRIISTLLLAIGPVEKIHVRGGWDFRDLEKSGVSFAGEIVPILIGIFAGLVEAWQRSLDKEITALEGKKYPAKAV